MLSDIIQFTLSRRELGEIVEGKRLNNNGDMACPHYFSCPPTYTYGSTSFSASRYSLMDSFVDACMR